MSLSLKVTASGPALATIRDIVGKLKNPGTFYAAAADIMVSQTQTRFSEQRSPDGIAWAPLAPSTVAQRGSDRPILERSGDLRRIKGESSISYAKAGPSGPLPYAAIHQFGGQAGRGKSTTIPARPYLGFGDEDITEIEDLAKEMFFAGL